MKNNHRAAKLDARGVSPEERVRLGSLMGETDSTDLREYSCLLLCISSLMAYTDDHFPYPQKTSISFTITRVFLFCLFVWIPLFLLFNFLYGKFAVHLGFA